MNIPVTERRIESVSDLERGKHTVGPDCPCKPFERGEAFFERDARGLITAVRLVITLVHPLGRIEKVKIVKPKHDHDFGDAHDNTAKPIDAMVGKRKWVNFGRAEGDGGSR